MVEIEKPVFRSKAERHQFPRQHNRHHDQCPSLYNSPSYAASRDHDRARKRNREAELREKEIEAIKEQYFGSTKPKKQVPKPTTKSRFSPNWDNAEDTSRDLNTLYQNPHISQPLFGRGLFAGIDRPLQKRLKDERHWSKKVLDEMTDRDWRIFKEDFGISYKGSKIPCPMRTWGKSKLNSQLLKTVEKAGYETPTPIQRAAIPLGIQQRDVIGIAETGSGKTAAFVLPMLNYISKLPPIRETDECDGPYAVVLAPSRELALQIKRETDKFARYMGINVTLITGGRSYEEQGFKISQGCEIVVATPGRLLDCLEKRYAVLNQCNYVVLDEADRMIDEGLEQQVVKVLDAMPSSNLKPENEDEELDARKVYRTTYMFSATMRPAVERLARKYLRNPVVVTIGAAGKATDLITQDVIMMQDSEKMHRLQKLISGFGGEKKVIVFVNTRESVDKLAKNLDMAGYRVITLHGGKSQDQRDLSLEGFRSNKYNIMVATDVVGRGIDIPDVSHVINYDMPGDIEKYTHRIGRTGRAGKTGLSTTFLTKHDTSVFYDLKQLLIQSSSNVPSELARHEASKFKPGTVLENPPRCSDTGFPR